MAVPFTFGSATAPIPLANLDSNFATPITLGNTAIQLGNTVTTLNNMTLANATVSSGNVTVTSASLSGNLTFTGTGNRITGDFSNATVANRVMFQTSTANSNTVVVAIPNGTAVTSVFSATGLSSDPTNAPVMNLLCSDTEGSLRASKSGTGAFQPMTFYTGGSERMRIDTSGNVGIGATNTTGNRFYAYATSGHAGTFYSNSGGSTTGLNTYGITLTGNMSSGSAECNIVYGSAGGGLAFNSWNGSDQTERMRIDSSGNVGIGTSSPTQKLDVYTNSASISYIVGRNTLTTALYGTDASGAGYAYIGSSTAGSAANMYVGTIAAASTIFVTNGAEKARIDSSGYVGINQTPASTGGMLQVTYDSSARACLRLTTNNSSTAGELINFIKSTGTATGAISFGPSQNTIVYGGQSDYRLKENIAPMIGALETVAKLKPVTYKWKSDGSDGQGFIAHELQEVVPDAVVGEKDAVDADGNPKYQQIDTSFLVATLTAAIQELSAKNDALEARIVALEAK